MRSGPEIGEVLDLLARGERAEASVRIRSALERGRGGAGAGVTPAQIEEVLVALESVEAGRTAVREGRVEDLTAHARAAVALTPLSLPWLAMYAGSLLQAAFRFSGDAAVRDEALRALGRVADRVSEPEAAVPARAMMASVHLLAGSYHSTFELCEAALALAESAGLADSPPAALAHQFRGYVLFEWNRREDAQASLERAWRASGESGGGVRSGVARVLAALHASRGETRAAQRWLGRLESVVSEPMTLRNREWLTAVRLRHSIGSGDLRPVDDWLRAWDYRPDTLAGATDAHLASRLQELEGVLALFEATGRWTEVLELAPLIHRAAAGRRRWFDARALSAWAVALEALGRSAEADDRWRAALLAGDPGSFVRVYVEGSSVRGRLLDRALATDPPDPHALRVRAAAPDSNPSGPADSGLTDRQMDVLRLVERGFSNKAIARELSLSLSTVKTHLREAFNRLDARSRTEAVAKARDLGWLQSGMRGCGSDRAGAR